MLVRVRRLERSQALASPFERGWGSIDEWEAECIAGIEAGEFDSRDMPFVITAVRRWHVDGVWSA